MPSVINLVKGDTGPDYTITLYDAASNVPIDVSGATDVVRLHFRREGQGVSPVVTSIVGIKSNGGGDGVVTFIWPSGALGEVGYYEGEIEITFASGKKETCPDIQRFYIREQIG